MDDEFPIRNPGTSVATPLRAEFKESQNEPDLTGQDHTDTRTTQSPPRDAPYPANTEPRSAPQAPSPVADLPVSRPQRTLPSNPVRHSIVSADAVHLKDRDRPSRKQSKLRGAIRKFLDRKKKHNPYDTPSHTESEAGSLPVTTKPSEYRTNTQPQPQPQPQIGNTSQNNDPRPVERPDPRSRSRPFPGAESKRSASLPITEFDRALRSHSVRPEDVRAIESARNSLSAEFGLARRQTGPLRSKENDPGGLSPRPASSQGRDSRTAQHDEDPSEIGRAITSDYVGSRRRSRSLSGLPEVEEDHDKSRRRSDEIRYWRESYDPAFMSPVSSNAPDGEDAGRDKDDIEDIEEDATQPLQPPPEPYKFDTYAAVKRMGGLKITQAAELETRVCNLESRVRRLEQALDQVSGAVPDFHRELDRPHRPAPLIPTDDEDFDYTITRPQTSPAPRGAESDMGEFRTLRRHKRDISAVSLEEPSTGPASSTLPVPDTSERPTSIATIRGVSSLPILSKDPAGPFTVDHYATLLALVHTERSAREALEAQVKRLGYQVSVLSKSTAVRRDPDFDPPPTAKSFGDRSAFDHDDDENEAEITMLIDTQARSIDPEDSGIGTGHGDDSEYSDIYETPREEGHSFGAFGEDLEEEDQQKKSARTLSLSQLTRKTQHLPQDLPHAI